MSILADVIAALDPLRAHKGKLPNERVLPAIVVTVVTGTDEMVLRGDGELRRRVVQLDAWGTVESGADDYMEQARTKMLAASGFKVARIDVSGAPDYEPEANLFRSSLEFAIWFN